MQGGIIVSRQAREKSQSGIYHVMSRGINGQDIFNDEEDLIRYLETLNRVKQNKRIEVYGYCLMENHLQLLIKEGEEGLASAMKRIGIAYARWYIGNIIVEDTYFKIDTKVKVWMMMRIF